LAELPGHWVGHGFNLIARPNQATTFFLELNSTQETLDFIAVGGPIPNRGSLQPDIFLHGIHYLQQVTDRETDTGIHIEPGFWIHVPPTTDPANTNDTYVRLATIPHGDSLLAQDIFTTTVAGGPIIQPVDSTPFTGAIPTLNASPAQPITDDVYLRPFLTDPLPPDIHLPATLTDAEVIKGVCPDFG
jgi:hypothetical protein